LGLILVLGKCCPTELHLQPLLVFSNI
jgi:hypothetical protein